ncbi:MAG TPA: hypothetical protein VJZ26_04450 [Blastocatellia bacterium]|nr:hypothetical protein [Blastocatellia bacterium]
MRKIQITHFLSGLFLAMTLAAQSYAQSSGSRPPDAGENIAFKTKASILMDLEIMEKAEQRAEELRAKLFDLQMQEIALQACIDDLDYRMTPDGIHKALEFVGSARPMDELRAALRVRLENEKARVNKHLELLASSRERLEAAISRADAEVERLRQRLSLP